MGRCEIGTSGHLMFLISKIYTRFEVCSPKYNAISPTKMTKHR